MLATRNTLIISMHGKSPFNTTYSGKQGILRIHHINLLFTIIMNAVIDLTSQRTKNSLLQCMTMEIIRLSLNKFVELCTVTKNIDDT